MDPFASSALSFVGEPPNAVSMEHILLWAAFLRSKKQQSQMKLEAGNAAGLWRGRDYSLHCLQDGLSLVLAIDQMTAALSSQHRS